MVNVITAQEFCDRVAVTICARPEGLTCGVAQILLARPLRINPAEVGLGKDVATDGLNLGGKPGDDPLFAAADHVLHSTSVPVVPALRPFRRPENRLLRRSPPPRRTLGLR